MLTRGRAAALAAAVALVYAALVLGVLVRQRDAMEALASSRGDVEAYARVLAQALDAENAQRDYLATGRARFLGEFEDAALRARTAAGALPAARQSGSAAAADPANATDAALMHRLVDSRLQSLEEQIRSRSAEASAAQEAAGAAASPGAPGTGPMTLDSIRLLARAHIASGLARRQGRAAEADRASSAAALMAVLGGVIAALLLAALHLMRGDSRPRVPTDTDLVESNARLRRQALGLRRSEERLRALVATATDLITVVDGAGRVTYDSPSVGALLGYGPAERTGVPLSDYVHAEDRAAFRRDFECLLARGGSVEPRQDLRLRTAKGEWRRFSVRQHNLLDVESVGGIVLTARDVTEARELEEQLLQAQKMEAIGRLAGGIAHDFNNVITAIHGNLSLLTERVPESSDLRPEIDEAVQATQGAADLTRQLLAFSRRQPSRSTEVDLNELVRETTRLLSRLVGPGVEVRTLLCDRAVVRADPGQMGQILMNLAVNARDAMPGGGVLTVETRCVHMNGGAPHGPLDAAPGPCVLLGVSDTGEGMDRETQKRIFEPFFTTKEPGRGTGLGLSTVYEIVRGAGGAIRVASEAGAGTTFRIYLPLAESAVLPAAVGSNGS